MSALPKFTMRELLDAGVHFGHKTMRWNPRMAPFIYGARNNLHIIDLQQTVPLLHIALKTARDVAANNGRVLFVSTKRQGSDIVAESAKSCGQYYVNHRWLGGMLTNWDTVSQSIKTLRDTQRDLADPEMKIGKKERLRMERHVEKLELSLGGIKDMGGTPDLLFVIDTNKENIAIKEANKLGIPVIAIVDTNSNPENIDHIVPGNDDAVRSIQLYCDLISEAIIGGLKSSIKPSNDSGKPEIKKETKKAEKPEAKKEAKKPAAKKEAAKKAPAKKKAEDKKESKPEAKEEKEAAKKPVAKKKPVKKAEKAAEKAAEAPAKKAVSS